MTRPSPPRHPPATRRQGGPAAAPAEGRAAGGALVRGVAVSLAAAGLATMGLAAAGLAARPSLAAPPLTPPPAVVESADATAIRQRFEAWTAAFNARRFAELCDLFAEDVVGETVDAPPRGRDRICDDLRRLGESARSYRYDLDLREIAVFDDTAVVRPTWTLTVTGGGLPGPVTVREIGLDVLRRDPDGSWRVVRFLAAAEPRR